MAIVKPKKGNVIFDVEGRWIKILGEIVPETAYWFNKFLYNTNVRNYAPVHILIDSIGGDAEAGFLIHAMLFSSVAPAITVITKKAYSTAFIISQAGYKRKIYKDGIVALHESYFNFKRDCHFNGSQLREFATNLEINDKYACRLVSQSSKMPLKIINQFFREGKILTAKEAKRLNLVDEIISKKIKTKKRKNKK